MSIFHKQQFVLRFSNLVASACILVAIPSFSFGFDIVETFSGTGSHSSSGGPVGFDNSGWFEAGDPGSFATNGFGETVYEVETDANSGPQDGVFRLVGSDSFVATAEFSNPDFNGSSQGAFAGIILSDSPDLISLSVFGNPSGYSVSFAGTADGNTFGGGNATLPANTDRFTLRLQYQPDQINGGGLFDAFVQANETGSFTHVGTIDGSQYTTDPSSFRTLFLGTTTFSQSNSAYVELDHFTLSNVPEPSAFLVSTIGLLCLASRRRR